MAIKKFQFNLLKRDGNAMADYAEWFWSFPARLRNLLETCYNREWKAWEGHAHDNLLWMKPRSGIFEAFSRSWAFDAKRTFTSFTVLIFIAHWKHRWRLFKIFSVQFCFLLIKGPEVYIWVFDNSKYQIMEKIDSIHEIVTPGAS